MKTLYGMICRDPTLIDLELLATAGYHVVWIDLEHGLISPPDAEDGVAWSRISG